MANILDSLNYKNLSYKKAPEVIPTIVPAVSSSSNSTPIPGRTSTPIPGSFLPATSVNPKPTNTGTTYGVSKPKTVAQVSAPNISTITSRVLAPQAEIRYETPKPIIVPTVSGLDTSIPQVNMTAPETEANDLTKRLKELTNSLVGESAYRTEKQNEQNFPELLKTQTDLAARLKAIQNEQAAIPLQLQQSATGRGITAAGLQPIETAALRNNAIQALSVSSLLEASKGNISLANDLVERAVAAKFDPIREEIATKSANLDLILNSPEYTIAEKNRAQAQKAEQDAALAKLETEKENSKKIYDISLKAAENGADSMTLRNIQAAKTPEEAVVLAGSFISKPEKLDTSVVEIGGRKILMNNQTGETIRDLGSAVDTSPAGTTATTDTEKLSTLQDKISLIDELIGGVNNSGAVGPNAFARTSLTSWLTGARQKFVGGVKQLTSRETLDTLINLKAAGGTLGALSDQERLMLQSAATKIGQWEIKDSAGNGTGFYNVTESDFKKELETIKKLTERALKKAAGEAGIDTTSDPLGLGVNQDPLQLGI